MSTHTDFLPPHLLERLGGLELIAKTVVRGFQAGVHRSPLRGAGEDFAKHRDYQQGDDLRYLDWKLYARTDRLYVREFEERSNLQAYLVIDASASMAFASADGVTKARYASYVAAALAHLMIGAGDAVGLAAFGAEPRLLVAPRSRKGHLHDLLLNLERLQSAGAGSAADVLDRVGAASRRGGRVVLVSDLLEDDDGEAIVAAAGRLRARGDEVIAMRVLTPEEYGDAAPDAGLFFDPERPAREIAAAPRHDGGYAARVAAYYASLADRLRERGVEYVPLTTAQPVEEALSAWVNRRRGAA
ncbi:MAG TPA: DUF58 domain-containing protein [Longimicrobium sp.]|nr:DUF58 domain-containing protein [Longimicrobium sp.]